jgi:hypothetical protein
MLAAGLERECINPSKVNVTASELCEAVSTNTARFPGHGGDCFDRKYPGLAKTLTTLIPPRAHFAKQSLPRLIESGFGWGCFTDLKMQMTGNQVPIGEKK